MDQFSFETYKDSEFQLNPIEAGWIKLIQCWNGITKNIITNSNTPPLQKKVRRINKITNQMNDMLDA